MILSFRYSPGFTLASPDPDVLILPAEFYETGYEPGAAAGFAHNRDRVWYLATDTPVTDTDPEVQARDTLGYRLNGRMIMGSGMMLPVR